MRGAVELVRVNKSGPEPPDNAAQLGNLAENRRQAAADLAPRALGGEFHRNPPVLQFVGKFPPSRAHHDGIDASSGELTGEREQALACSEQPDAGCQEDDFHAKEGCEGQESNDPPANSLFFNDLKTKIGFSQLLLNFPLSTEKDHPLWIGNTSTAKDCRGYEVKKKRFRGPEMHLTVLGLAGMFASSGGNHPRQAHPDGETGGFSSGESGSMAERITGMADPAVDDRLRVALPFRMLKALRTLASEADPAAQADEELTVVVGLGLEGTLCVWPKNVHEELIEWLAEKPEWDQTWRQVRATVEGSWEEQKLDKQNRIKIPSLLGRKLGLSGNVVVRGAGRHMEIISMDAWEKQVDALPGLVAAGQAKGGQA